jgi:hypothetical protein
MQQLTYVLYQLDEAQRYVKAGRLEQLRLALLLLDNAAELQLDRRVRQEMQLENVREGMRTRAIEAGAAHRDALSELTEWTPLSARDKKALSRSFEAKLRYLVERKQILDPRLASILKYLHRYRNEAYHEGRVRRDTVRTAALILFEANCELVLTVFRVVVYSSSDDYSWLSSRFGVKPGALFGSNLEPLINDLRSLALPTLDSVIGTLSDHLRSRVDELRDSLDFIVAQTDVDDTASALKLAQFEPVDPFDFVRWPEKLPDFVATWTLHDIELLESDIASIDLSTQRLEAFEAFSRIEKRLETIEDPVHSTAASIDSAIQMEIDIARGK